MSVRMKNDIIEVCFHVLDAGSELSKVVRLEGKPARPRGLVLETTETHKSILTEKPTITALAINRTSMSISHFKIRNI